MTRPRRMARAAALLAGLVLGACAAPTAAPTSPTASPTISSTTASTTAPNTADAPATSAGATSAGSVPAGTGGRAEPVPPPAAAPAAPAAPVAPVALPWPTAGAADAAALQATADDGGQPWLLDPSEVALAYAAAAHGWTDAQSYPGPGGTSVDVRNPVGDQITLTLAQPVRRGEGGIWVVTSETPA